MGTLETIRALCVLDEPNPKKVAQIFRGKATLLDQDESDAEWSVAGGGPFATSKIEIWIPQEDGKGEIRVELGADARVQLREALPDPRPLSYFQTGRAPAGCAESVHQVGAVHLHLFYRAGERPEVLSGFLVNFDPPVDDRWGGAEQEEEKA